jgi:hypothetical protein
MFSVRGNIDEVARLHFQRLFVALESKPGCTFEQNHEFSPILIVPEALG